MLSASDQPSAATTQLEPRLVLDKLVCENFKSYGGSVEIGPFHSSFSAVVGPNGSGKSNVIDALLFVFGFKAKKLRQAKLSHLIHSSAAYPNLRSAAVHVHFVSVVTDPATLATTRVEGSELVVSRSVEKQVGGSDKSSYSVNGRSSTYTQVTQLLKGKGIDLDHKRFLILQGEVESIAQMKPKARTEHEDGLLEYLEDIIGTSSLKPEIEELTNRVETLSQERTAKLQRVQAVEREKTRLEGSKNEAVKFIRMENQLAIAQNAFIQANKLAAVRSTETVKQEMADRASQIESEKQQAAELKLEITELKKSHSRISTEYDSIAESAESVRQDLAKYDRAEVEFKEREKHFNTRIKRLNKAIHTDSLAQSESSTWIRNFDDDLTTREEELSDLTKRLEHESRALEEVTNELLPKTSGFQAKIEKRQRSLEPYTEEINRLEAEISVAQGEFSDLRERTTRVEVGLQDAKSRLAMIETNKRESEFTLSDCKQSVESLTTEKTNVRARVKEIRGTELPRVKQLMQESTSRLAESKATAQSASTRVNIVKTLLSEQAKGRLDGVHGRLGDLGIIDAEYDAAVTTALGGSLDHIVVNTVAQGQACIAHLKRTGQGRATFICLDKLPAYKMSKIATPESVPRLFDLIQPRDDEDGVDFCPAFYHVCRDTLVASDLAHARRVAFGGSSKRWRVVTLDGQVIDASGTMSGGGTRVSRGGMSSSFSAKSKSKRGAVNDEAGIAQMEKEFLKHEQVLAELNEELSACEARMSEIEKLLPPAKHALQKAELDYAAVVAEIAQIKVEIQELSKAGENVDQADIDRMAALKAQIAKSEAKLEQTRASCSGIETEISDLQEEIMKVGGVRLRTQKAVYDGVAEQIETCNQGLTRLKVEKSTREKNLIKLEASLEKKNQDLAEATAELEALSENLDKQREAAITVRKRVQEAKDVLEEKEAELAEITQNLEEKVGIIDQIRESELQLTALQSKAKKKMSDNAAAVARFDQELFGLKLQEIGFVEDEDEDEEMLDELEIFDDESLSKMDLGALERKVERLISDLERLSPNLEVLAEYKQKYEDYMQKAADLAAITSSREEAKEAYDNLCKKRLDSFMIGFTTISQKLKEMYQMITLGGNAELELVDSLDPFSEGIVFSVMPPKKSWKNISNLSGGEKTLSSLALVFALHHYKPTPLYVMDEIDAALDFRNVSIVANYIKERTRNGQFVIISLRNNMFELADHVEYYQEHHD
ncbi:MAG: hypothetical protein SGCHY_002240 [Lobulomycetales sp.]